jgi:uncharacterized protein YndB with AHSA1/START domain
LTLKTIAQTIRIEADIETVWRALVSPQAGETWRIAHFKTDWRVGESFEIEAPIGSKTYRDKGRVLQFERPSLLQYSYWSRIAKLPDVAEACSIITIRLVEQGEQTTLQLEQLVPPTPNIRGPDWEIGEDSGWRHWEFYWRASLPVLKQAAEELSLDRTRDDTGAAGGNDDGDAG